MHRGEVMDLQAAFRVFLARFEIDYNAISSVLICQVSALAMR
jgi:hypothetical protein